MNSKLIDVIIVSVLVLAVLAIPGYNDMIQDVWKAADRPVIVIDPGHGGIDGGAEAADGTIEKDINLSIALKLRTLLEKEGIEVVMTRETEEGLYKEDETSSVGNLKTEDMHERRRIINGADADLTVSIHLNSFPQDTSVKGAQVFYPSEGDEEAIEASRKAAVIIQEEFNKTVNTDKKRTEMEKNDVYLLRDVSSPIVITECGFLSNIHDLSELKKESYQEKISKSIKASICKYLEDNGNKTQ